MAKKILRITEDRQSVVAPAADVLRSGGVLVFPTETVYGVGVSSARPDALEKLRRLKERPDAKPFQFLAADAEMAEELGAVFTGKAKRLARKFWPGPLTLVVPDSRSAEESLGIRVPASELVREICRRLGAPIISSSANPAGAPPPADAAAADCFGDAADLLIDAGAAAAGVPSTVVRCAGDGYEILRAGGIPAAAVDAAWNETERTAHA